MAFINALPKLLILPNEIADESRYALDKYQKYVVVEEQHPTREDKADEHE